MKLSLYGNGDSSQKGFFLTFGASWRTAEGVGYVREAIQIRHDHTWLFLPNPSKRSN
jgi:hypothetical protein